MKRTIIGTVLVLGSMLSAAHADTWVFRDTLRPHGHARSMALKRADGRKCGAQNGRSFAFGTEDAFQQCMMARGWVLDHVIPDPPQSFANGPSYETSAPIDNSADEEAARQRDADNLQNMINTQNMVDQQNAAAMQQMQNDMQSQQQIMNNANNP
jgi:hypothetical protein